MNFVIDMNRTREETLIKWKSKKYHTIETFPKSNRKIVESMKIEAVEYGFWHFELDWNEIFC